MMKQGVIIVSILVIVLGLGMWYAYTHFELPYRKKPVEYVNISISAIHNGNKVSTGYVIETIDGTRYGNTTQYYELIKVPKNEMITAYNVNLKNQLFYQDNHSLNASEDGGAHPGRDCHQHHGGGRYRDP